MIKHQYMQPHTKPYTSLWNEFGVSFYFGMGPMIKVVKLHVKRVHIAALLTESSVLESCRISLSLLQKVLVYEVFVADVNGEKLL